MDRLFKKNKRATDAEGRLEYTLTWNIGLMEAPCAKPVYCCFAAFCSPCASYSLRKQALYGDMSRYLCCAGHCPCSGRMGESNCPEFCLCLETVCCFAQSVASTRFLVQDERRIQNTCCDNCIIGVMLFLQYLACVVRLVACITQIQEIEDLADILDCVADVTYCTVCACMQTQVKHEFNVRDGLVPPKDGCAGAGSNGTLTMNQAPQHQVMQTGPSVGYTQQPPYGTPPMSYAGTNQATYGYPLQHQAQASPVYYSEQPGHQRFINPNLRI